jgi:hypothetical protein
MPHKTVPNPTSTKPTFSESKAYAEKAYANYTSTVKWEDHQMVYYSNLKKWAAMNGRSLVQLPESLRQKEKEDMIKRADDRINLTFTHIRFLETTDPQSADKERVRLYAELAKAWISATDSLTRQERQDAALVANTITTSDKAEEFSRQLLSIHVLLNPVVDRFLPGASHYENFEAFVIGKYGRKQYQGDPQAWWFVHNALYETWAKDYERQDATPPPPIAPWTMPTTRGTSMELQKAAEVLAAATKEVERMLQELKTAQEQLKTTNTENKELQAELKKASEENKTRGESLEKATRELNSAKDELKTAKDGLADATRGVKSLAKELESAKQDLRKTSVENKSLSARLEEAVAALKLAEEEVRRNASATAKKEKKEGGPEPEYQI